MNHIKDLPAKYDNLMEICPNGSSILAEN